MLNREEWLPLARKLDWEFSYVTEEAVFPRVISGEPWLPHSAWSDWDEPFHVTYSDYVINQAEKDKSVYAVHDAMGKIADYQQLSAPWVNALKLHSATLPLAEFAAVVGNLRGARFGRDSAWRVACTFAALDEVRHTHIPLLLMHQLVPWAPQFDWTHKFYHTDNWVAIAARHLTDELLLAANPIEFAIGTNFVFETGFTNVQFVGLSSLAREAGDNVFASMTQSIQSDEARHSLIGAPVLKAVLKQDPDYVQYLLDKWFWRNWQLFAVVTGFSMDYLTPLEQRTASFKEFIEEWVIDQYLSTLEQYGLKRPWYWDIFLQSIDTFHHMVYISAYTYRATVWFNFALPSPQERAWLQAKYPKHWHALDAVWERINQRWQQSDVDHDFSVHGTSIVGFCHLCQLVLCHGTPQHNSAVTMQHNGRNYIFCSEPCRWIFTQEVERYCDHKDIVNRVLSGTAPGNILAMLRETFGLSYATWGKDIRGGRYDWITRNKHDRQGMHL